MDSKTSIISRLKATELFEHCDDGALKAVSASCETIHLKKGEVLFSQGDESDTLFIVVDGFLRITVDQPQMGELQIAKVGAGKLIGEMHTMKVDCRTATVVAEQDAELLSIPYALFREILESSLPLRLELNRINRRRFRENALVVVLTKMFGQKDGLALHHFVAHMDWRRLKKGAYLYS